MGEADPQPAVSGDWPDQVRAWRAEGLDPLTIGSRLMAAGLSRAEAETILVATKPAPDNRGGVFLRRSFALLVALIGALLAAVTGLAYLSLLIKLERFAREHQYYYPAPSCGDIGEGLLLMFAVPVGVISGYLGGLIFGVFKSRLWDLIGVLGFVFGSWSGFFIWGGFFWLLMIFFSTEVAIGVIFGVGAGAAAKRLW